jgi:hypothetical protein
MTWDDEKENFETRPNIGANNKLPADEWNAHVDDQKNHAARHESGGIDEITVDGLAGDLADAQDPKQGVVNDFVDALVAGGDKVSTTYDSGAGTLTIDTAALDTEEVEDAVDGLLAGGPQVTTTYDDAVGSLTISINAPTQAAFEDHSERHEDGGSDELDVSGLSGVLADAQTPQTEAVEDIVAALLAAGDKVDLTYNDAGDVLTIDTTALDEEEVEDAVAALVTAGNAISVNYDDANDALSIAVDESALSFYDGTNLTAPVDNQSVKTEDADIGTLKNKIQTTGNDSRAAVRITEHAFDLPAGEYATFFEVQKTNSNEIVSGFSRVSSVRESNGKGFHESDTFVHSAGGEDWGTSGSTAVQISTNVRLQIDAVDPSVLKYQIRPTDGFHNTGCDVFVVGRPQPTPTDPA